ncbi:MAG: glycoside hydrolase family 172 protein [Nitriliruptorales bacterium]
MGRKLGGGALLGALAFAMVGAPVAGAQPRGADVLPASQEVTSRGKGPTGWDSYRQLDRLPELTRGVETRQFSSFDRDGGNNDGFLGTYSCLRHSASGCVIAEHIGAGEIASIWSTRADSGRQPGDVVPNGKLRVVLDGQTVIDAPMADVVAGRLGPPFAFPLVADADRSSGGVYLKVPMPFRRSMLVETEHNPFFYHVTFRVFADAEGVETFDPNDQAADVVALLRSAGTEDPKPQQAAATTLGQDFSLLPGQTTRVQLEGPGLITALRMVLPQVVGPGPTPQLLANGLPIGPAGSGKLGLAVDPRNAGVRITRQAEAAGGAQLAPALVDGNEVVLFSPPRRKPGSHDLVQVAAIPATATAGRSTLTLSDLLLEPGATYWVDSLVDGRWLRSDTIQLQTAPALPPVDPPEELVSESDSLLRGIRLRITFDGRRTVDAPIGEFFGSGLGEYPVSALLFDLDPEGWYSSWWPMPYARGAAVELFNESNVPVDLGRLEVSSSLDRIWARRLREGVVGYFHATARRGPTVPTLDWPFVDTAGEGKFVGVSHTMEGPVQPLHLLDPTTLVRGTAGMRGYLEGDERAYVDGSPNPSVHGTGTEDFYEAGFYFHRGPFSNFSNGHSAHEFKGHGCAFECDAAYRLMISDAISFRTGLRFGIEHGGTNEWQAMYGSTAFWYGGSHPSSAWQPTQLNRGR